jgi:serine/threonine-protein kinase
MSDEAADLERILISRGLLTPDQLQEAHEIRRKICETGVSIELEEVLRRKGFLNPQQLALVRAAIGKGRTDLIQGYEIISKLGQGGMGAVYKARQISMDRIVAIKVLLPSFAGEKNAVERFLREAKVIAHLSHPNLVSGIDAGYQNGIYYCVMEYVEGQTLSKLLEPGKPIDWKQAFTIARQVSLALAHAQERKIVHRDVKPENIILARSGVAKLMDLGLAKLAGGSAGPQNASLTGSGFLIGTPAYMSPEQAEGRADLDVRTDIYSLGLTLFEMLCGRRAFDGDTPMALLSKRLREKIPLERLAAAGVPDSAVAVVRKMTARDRQHRYGDAANLAADLEAVLAGRTAAHAAPLPARPTRNLAPSRRRFSAAWAAVGLILLLAGGAGIFLLNSSRPKPPPSRTAAREPDLRPEPPRRTEEPRPEPPKETPRDPEPPKEFEQLWTSALDYESRTANPEDVLLNYVELRERLRGTPKIAVADEKIALWKKKLSDAAAQETSRLEARFEALRAGLDFAAAARELSEAGRRFSHPALQRQPGMGSYSEWPAFLSRQETLLKTAIEDTVRGLRDRAADLLKARDFDAAEKTLEKLKALGVPAAVGEALKGLDDVSRERAAHRADLDRLAKVEPQILAAHWKDACALASELDFEAAAEKLRDARSSLALPESIASVEELAGDMDLAGSVRKDVNRDLPAEKIASLYASAKRTAPPAKQPLALFLFALHGLDAATAEREFQKLKQAGATLRPEYLALFETVRTRAREIKNRIDQAAALLKEADNKFKNAKTRDEALKSYRELLDKFSDALPERTVTAVKRKLEQAPAHADAILDAREMSIGKKAECRLSTDDRCALRQVIEMQGEADEEDDVVEFEFDARADVPYKLWIYMGYFNIDRNALRVSFGDDVEISGAIGDARSGRGYVVQYYPRDNRHGYGWSDRDMYGGGERERVINLSSSPGPVFKYRTAGRKRIQLFVQEPGTPVARVLISADRFVRSMPGDAEAQPKR